MKSFTTCLFGLVVVVVSGALTARHTGAAIIADYTFAGGSAASTDAEPNSTAGGFTKNRTSADWGISSSSGTAFARSSATTNSETAAVTAGDYFSFTVTPDAGFELDLTQLQFDTTHNLTHPTPPSPDTGATMSFFIRSSADGFAANVGPTYAQAWDTTTTRTVDLSGAAYRDIQVPTEFRMYVHDSGVDLLENGARLDNVMLGGTVVPPGTTAFQEGVSPTAAYTADAVYIRSGDAVATRANENFNGDPDRELIVGWTADPDELRTLLEFDVSAIPASDQIDSVSLVLRTESSPTGLGGEITINMYEYGFDVDESIATWNAPGAGDGTPGGTLGTLLNSATFAATAAGLDVTFSDTAAFQAAVSNALASDGLLRLLLTRSDSSGTGHRFARFDDETVATLGHRPELLVTHSSSNVVPEPSSATLALLGLLGLAWFGWRRQSKDL